METVPVVIKDVDEDEAFELALVENIHRADLNPLEEAEAYKRLMGARGYTQAELAERLGKSRPAVANTLRLLGLDTDVQRRVSGGELSEGAARALLALPTAGHQIEVAEAAASEDLSVRQVESVVRRIKGGESIDVALSSELSPAPTPDSVPLGTKPTAKKRSGKKLRDDAQVRALKEELQRSLGTRVSVNDRGGRGSIEIFFDSYGVLDSILERFRGS
jgi:ParB family chromosome partitioning protein